MSSEQLKSYNADAVRVIFGAILMDGFADGSMVKVEQASARWTKKTGSNGAVVRSKNNDFSGKVTVRLMQTSPVNGQLAALAEEDRITGQSVRTLMVRDGNGLTQYVAAQAWIAEVPASDFDREAKEREWVFECAELVGGEGGQII